jgi:hypothetical protein
MTIAAPKPLIFKIEVPTRPGPDAFSRADLRFEDVGHSWVSYEARVFFNNPKANGSTPSNARNGYAGSFHIFGHGGCFGDEGHCDIPTDGTNPFDRRAPHQLTPITKTVIVTNALRTFFKQRPKGGTLTITAVPVVRESAVATPENLGSVLTFQTARLVTYE